MGFLVVAVAQLVESRIVIPVVVVRAPSVTPFVQSVRVLKSFVRMWRNWYTRWI